MKADKMRKGCGSKLCHFGILSASDAEKCANHCSLCIDNRSVLGINLEGIKTVSGICQEYAERLRNECGFTKLDSVSCPRLVRDLVDARYYYACAYTIFAPPPHESIGSAHGFPFYHQSISYKPVVYQISGQETN